jgi:hypothetical protein
MAKDYMRLLEKNHPGVAASCTGDPSVYANVTWHDPAVAEATLDSEYLAFHKQEKLGEIDARTDELIALGFNYASRQFSLGELAQIKMIGTHQIKGNPALSYPINWNSIDDSDVYSIANEADLDGFYLTGVGTLRARLDSGTALKDSVRAAADVAAVDAVVDGR